MGVGVLEWLKSCSLGWIDWLIIAAYCVLSILVGLYFTRRASKSTDEYFVSGRSMTWWLLGTSMIATSFASDTPLAVTSYIRSSGVWANWWWFCFAIGQLLAIFSFSLFWRRAEVVTDNQLIEMRYSGNAAAALRGFKAAFGATVYNFIVMGWVLNSIGTITEVVVGIPKIPAIVIFSLVTLAYSAAGGIYAAVWTDLVQCVIMFGGMTVLACYAVAAAGGLDHVRQAVAADPRMSFMPPLGGGGKPLLDFLSFILVSWWASLNADGGGYIIQRMASARNERHSQLATLWFVIGTYALRLWPWVVVAAVSLILYPSIPEPLNKEMGEKAAFPLVMKDVLKAPGLMGLLIAAFVAAFMSTISTHLNWGASYMINDIYRRFFVRNAGEKHYVRVSYAANVVILAVAGIVAVFITKIEGAWEFVRVLGAGVGVILILRWFWWRISAWTEIAALATSFVISLGFEAYAVYQALWVDKVEYKLFGTPCHFAGVTWDFSAKLFVIVPVSLIAGIVATLLTRATDRERLVSFFRKVRPSGAWGDIAEEAGVKPDGMSREGVVGWIASIGFIYCFTFGIGKIIFGPTLLGMELLIVSGICAWLMWTTMRGKVSDGA